MFVVITTEEERRGPLARAKDRVTGGNLQSQRKVFLKNYYYHLTVRGARVPWNRVARMVGRGAGRLVAPPELEIPPVRGLGRYSPTLFEGRLTALAAAQALGDAGPPGSGSRTVGLVDEDGLWSWCCRELAPLCGAVRVYTKRPERYEVLSRQLMEDWGASVVLADTLRELESCDFAVSPAPLGVVKLGLPVITVDHSAVQGRPTINRLRLDLPRDLLAEVPAGVQPEAFLGAAYELGTQKFPLDFRVAECRVDGRRAGVGEVLLLGRRSPR